MTFEVAGSRLSVSDRRAALGIFVLTFLTYGYFFGGGGWNQNAHFDLTRAIVEQSTLRIDRFAANTGDVVRRDGHVYANKPPGLSFMGAVPYAFLWRMEASEGDRDSAPLLTINAWVVTVAVCGASGALIAVLIFLWGVEAGAGRGWPFAVSMVMALGTPLFAYSTLFFLHVPSGAMLLLSFYLMRRGRRGFDAGAGLAAGLAAMSNYLCIPALLLVPFVDIPRSLRRSRLLVYGGGASLPIIALAIYQRSAFGAVFRLPNTMNARFTTGGDFLGILRGPSLEALLGITVSPYRGMFFLSPVLIFALAGAVIMIRRRALGTLLPTSAMVLFFVLVNVSFNNWEGGFGIGARYLVPVLPLLGIWMLHASRIYRPLFVALAIVSVANNFVAAAVDPQPSGSIAHPLGEYLYPLFLTGAFPPDPALRLPWDPRLMTGHTSVNRQGMNERIPFHLHPPGSAEAEWASFNAGEALTGPGSPWSVLPIVVLVAGGTAILLRRVSGEEPAKGSGD